MKTFLKICGGIVAAVVLLIGGIFWFTQGLVETADAFFAAVKRQDIAAARGYLSEDFKASADDAALRDFLGHSALLDYADASWTNRQISGGRGELRGSITTAKGGTVPLALTFVRENGAWRIYSVQKPPAGLLRRTGSAALPSRPEQLGMAQTVLRDFAQSVREHSMRHFRDTTSQVWQKQFPPEKFESAFESAYTASAAFAGIGDVQPTIVYADEPGEHGELVLSGNAAGAADVIYFDAKYVFESDGWKLVGFHFKM